MQSRLMPWSVLLGFGLLVILGFWLALFPEHAQSSWLRPLRNVGPVRSPFALRVIGVLWVALLAFIFWFNSRHHAGR